MQKIYLDNAATTSIDPKVIEAMNKSYSIFGNPSSIHSFGQEARQVVDEARDTVCQFLNCKPTEIIFTSGGSESDNLAIRGIVDAWYSKSEIRNPKSETNSKSKISNSETGSQIIRLGSAYPRLKSGMTMFPHVITSAIEHHAVLHTVQDLEKEGKVEATYIKPNKKGIIQVEDIKSAIKPNTVLVSIMYVNNEIGTVQPIREIGKMLEARNKKQETITKQITNSKFQNSKLDPRVPFDCAQGLSGIEDKPEDDKRGSAQDDSGGKIYFHTDAVQAAEFFEMDVKKLHVDLLTMTAHKIHGPKGTGLLFVKKGTPINPEMVGGDQEFRLRAGTENVAGIVGLAEAIEEISKSKLSPPLAGSRQDAGQITNKNLNSKNRNSTECHSEPEFSGEESSEQSERAASPRSFADAQDDKRGSAQDDDYIRIKSLRDKLEQFILKNIPETYLNGDEEKRAPHISNISFRNAEGEAIILNLDFLGIAVSSGSACTARNLEPSHVLMAMDIPRELSHGAIRFSLSRETTEEEIDRVFEILPVIIKKLREMSPFK